MTLPCRAPVLRYLPLADARRPLRLLVVAESDATAADLATRGHDEVSLAPDALGIDPATGRAAPLPFAAGGFDAILLLDALADLPDDEGAIAEAARVLRPGGTLIVRVPYRGPLPWLDAANLSPYVGDVTGRGPRPPEASVLGWPWHYHRREVRDLLRPQRLRIRAARGSGLGLAEAVRLALQLLFRRLVVSEAAYRRTSPVADAIARVEERLSLGPLGYHLTVVAERMTDVVGDA